VVANWLVSALSLILPLLASPSPSLRLNSVFLAITPCTVLLSLNHEVLFFASFSLLVQLWPAMEAVPASPRAFAPTVDKARVAVTFIYFVLVAFFGTGNVASVSSFDPASTFRFVTVFSPFLMGALLIVKVILPFLLLGVGLRVLARRSGAPLLAIVLSVSALNDVLSINFLYLVQNEGSWQQIGMSISHFVICNSFILLVLLVFTVSGIYTRGVVDPKHGAD